MSQSGHADIVVIGAGAIGLSTAFWLQRAGRDVLMLDRCVGDSASYGNAATIATYGCLPMATPDIWRHLYTLLFATDSPLSIRLRHLHKLTPWLMRFMREATSKRMIHNANALASLVEYAWSSYVPLFDVCGANDLIVRNGALYFCRSARDFEAMIAGEYHIRRELGINQKILDRDGVAELEPALAEQAYGAIYFPDAAHLRDPWRLMTRIAETIQANGSAIKACEVRAIRPSTNYVEIVTDDQSIKAKEVVVAAGAWSKPLAASIGDFVPLDTERGYHIELPFADPPITRTCCPTDLGFYMTPLESRIRVAGTVELGDLQDGPTAERFDYLRRHATSILGQLPEPSSKWLGFRPSLPDSLPVIGRSPRCARVCYAFGHGHLGITLAGITGQITSEVIMGREPLCNIKPFRIDRF